VRRCNNASRSLWFQEQAEAVGAYDLHASPALGIKVCANHHLAVTVFIHMVYRLAPKAHDFQGVGPLCFAMFAHELSPLVALHKHCSKTSHSLESIRFIATSSGNSTRRGHLPKARSQAPQPAVAYACATHYGSHLSPLWKGRGEHLEPCIALTVDERLMPG